MKYLQNLHTHTNYCDGINNPEEVIEAAISKGFNSIGFSGHSYMSYSKEYGMSPENEKKYIKEINELKVKHKDRIDIFCGIEYDMYSDIDVLGYDYVIGSFHYFKIGDEYIGFDRSAECVDDVIDTYFDGNGMEYAKKYYESLAKLPEYVKADIIGHFDLVAKHNECRNYFDENSKEYMEYAISAAEALQGKIPYFEVNTGCISRGYRTTPYPSVNILKELKRLGFGAVITSDCHNAKMLDCGFDDASEVLQACGFKERYILTRNDFVPVGL